LQHLAVDSSDHLHDHSSQHVRAPTPRDLPQLGRRMVEAVATSDCQMLQRVWQELDYRIDICHVTKGGHIEHLQGRTESWSVSPSLHMLPFGMTIPATVPHRSEILDRIMNYPVPFP
jgi:hypothetical protein